MNTNPNTDRKSMEKSMNRLGRQIKGIKGDIEILRSMRDDASRMAKRIERVNSVECSKFTEMAAFYAEKAKAKQVELREVECTLAWERDVYTRRTMVE